MRREEASTPSRLRRFATAGFWAGLAAVAALAAVLVSIQLGWGRERDRVGIEALLTRALEQPVTIAELPGPLWPALELRELRVGPRDAPLLEIESARVDVGAPVLAPSLGWRIGSIRLESPVLRGPLPEEEAEAGHEAPRTSDPIPSPIPLTLAALDVRNGELEWSFGEGRAIRLAGSMKLVDVALHEGLRGLAASRGELELSVADAADARALVRTGHLRGELRRGVLRISEAQAAGPAGRFSANGRFELGAWIDGDPRAALELDAELADLDLGILSGRAELGSALAGRATLRLGTPDASLVPTTGRTELDLDGSASRLGALQTLRARAHWQGSETELESLELRGKELQVAASGRLRDGAIERLDVAADIGDLSQLAAFVPETAALSGSMSAHAKLVGANGALTGRVELTGERLGWRTMSWERAVARIRAEGERGFVVEALQLEGAVPVVAEPGGRIRRAASRTTLEGIALRSASTRIFLDGALYEAGFESLRVRVEELDLAQLRAGWALPEWLIGRVDAALTLDGPFAGPRAEGDVRWSGLDRGQLPADELRLTLSPKDDRHHVAATVLVEERTWLQGQASVPRRLPAAGLADLLPALDFSATVDRLELATLPPIAPDWLAELEGSISGELSGRFERGDPLPLLDGRLSVEGGAARLPGTGGRIQSLAGQLVLAGRELWLAPIELDWTLEGAPSAARIHLEGGLDADGFPRGLEIRTHDLDAALLGHALSAAAPVSGPIRAELRLSGAYRSPELEGEIAWRDPEIGAVRADALELSAVSEGARLNVRGRLSVAGRVPLQIEGTLPRSLDLGDAARGLLRSPELDLAVRADRLDLGILAPLARGQVRDPQGEASGSLQLRGSAQGPALSGALDLGAGSVRVPMLATTFAPITGRVTLEDDTLRVEDFRVQSGDGDLRLSGTLTHHELRVVGSQLRLDADRFPLSRRGLFHSKVSGAAELSGPADALVLTGQAALQELDVQVPRPEDPAAKEIRIRSEFSVALQEEPSAAPAAIDGLAMQIRVDVPASGRIRGLGADLQVEGELEVEKAPRAESTYAGELRVLRGSYLFEGRRFEVTRGIARLDGSSEVDPLLDVEASHPIRDVVILARLSGRVSDPIVKLTSEPSMPEDDVLSYVLFGRPASQLTEPGRDFVGGAAAQLASGLATSRLGEITQDLLKLDSIDVTNGNGNGVPTLGLGKTLNERTFVRVGKSLGIPAEDEIRVEVKITPRISVQSEITTEGNSGGDVLWKLDY